MKTHKLVFILLSLVNPVFCVELVPTAELLAAYLERDSELQSVAIDYEKQD